MKKLKGFVLLMFCCLFTGVVALSACTPTEETSDSSSVKSSTDESAEPTTLPAYANMDVAYTGTTQYTYEGTDITIDLSSSLITATSHIGDDAADLETETVTDYTLYYSINGSALTKVEGTSLTATRRGTYSFYAVKTYTVGEESTDMMGQFIVYVIDAPSAFAYNNDGTTSYEAKPEESDIGTDWTYTLTLASGATETISYADVTFEPSTSAGDNTVTVTYVDEYTCLVDGVVTAVTTTYTADVAYTVAGEIIATNVVLNISDLITDGTLSAISYSAETNLFNDNATTISVTATSDKTVSVDSNSKSIDGYSFTHRLKLGGQGSATERSVKVVTAGACTITVYMMSSSSSESRQVGLYQNITSTDADGNETATFTLIGTAQTVDGSAIAKYTYTVSAAGTYYLAAASGGTNVYGILVTY